MADIKNKNELKRRIDLFLDKEIDYSINEEFCMETMRIMKEFIGHASHRIDCAESKTKSAQNKLKQFKDKQEQGLLIELPCKVGDKVWFIRTSNIKPELVETEIEKVVLKKRGLYVQLSCNSFYETSCNSIGKTVFFTESEAEEALARMKGEREHGKQM